MTIIILQVTIGVTSFLCLLNIVFAYVFRKRRKSEVFSYLAVALLELLIFAFTLTLHFGVLHSIPYRLPSHLPFTRTEIGAAIAIGIGLFPAAYWHRTSAAQIRARIAQDTRAMKKQTAQIRVPSNTPGEWMN